MLSRNKHPIFGQGYQPVSKELLAAIFYSFLFVQLHAQRAPELMLFFSFLPHLQLKAEVVHLKMVEYLSLDIGSSVSTTVKLFSLLTALAEVSASSVTALLVSPDEHCGLS